MLEEVCGTVVFVSLGTGSGVDPNANGGGLGPWRMLGGNLEVLKIRIGSRSCTYQGQLSPEG